jgi:hypothetical protein
MCLDTLVLWIRGSTNFVNVLSIIIPHHVNMYVRPSDWEAVAKVKNQSMVSVLLAGDTTGSLHLRWPWDFGGVAGHNPSPPEDFPFFA